MNKRFILAIILIAAIFGFGFATGYFTGIPALDAPSAQIVTPAPVTPNTQFVSPPTTNSGAPTPLSRINLDAVLGPLPQTVFTSDGKHAIARYDFDIYKNPAESSQEPEGDIRSGMLVEVLEKREQCLKVPIPDKPKSENPQEESNEYVDPYAGKTLDCYKVRKDYKVGWVVDRDVLNFQVPVPTRDPRDLSWFFQKYGESTWYYDNALDENSFTNEEYERLIVAAQDEGAYEYDIPHIVLRLTLAKRLEENPADPELVGFKDYVKLLRLTPP